MTPSNFSPFGRPRSAASAVLLMTTAFALSACLSGGASGPQKANAGGNAAPKLSGSPPASTKVGEPWSFTPSAADPDGDPLTFTVANKPGWTSFTAANGSLSGEPQAGDEGTYSGITVTASDGNASDSLSFSVTVNQFGTGSVSVSWAAPTHNDDGSALTDLAAYKIYYGKSPGNYTEQIRIDNPGITTYIVGNLSPATYYFVATAINSNGFESNYSGVLETVVN